MSDLTLLIVGAGKLGRLVGQAWKKAHPAARVVAETRTEATHPELARLGFEPRLRPHRSQRSSEKFPYVLFSVPPSETEDYGAEAELAVRLWAGAPSREKSALLFTSSTSVYAEENGGLVTESSPTIDSPRAKPLLAAEAVFQAHGGAVLRLAGLYDNTHGPHVVYLKNGMTSTQRPDSWINLIHYEDAAILSALILETRPAVYLGCDSHPLRREEILSAALSWAKRTGHATPEAPVRFMGKTGPLGRRCDNRWTREQTGWKPKWNSFMEDT